MKKLHWSLLKRLYRLGKRHRVYRRLGRLWLLDNRNWVDQQLIIRRPYEVQQLALCRELIVTHGLDCFFDIGANFGLYSVLLAETPSLRAIHAFEPLPRNAHQLAANLYLNHLDNSVQLHPFALSDRSGQAELFVDPDSTGVSTLLHADQRQRRHTAYSTSARIPTRLFDELFPLKDLRALVKIDVEGAELLVLKGMQDFLSKNQAVLQIEITQGTAAEVDEILTGLGYSKQKQLDADAYYHHRDLR